MLDIFAQSIPAQNTIEKTVPGERIHWLTLRWSRARSSVSAGALLPGGGNADVGVHDRPAAAADGAAVAAALVRAEQRVRARQPPLQPHPAAVAARRPSSHGRQKVKTQSRQRETHLRPVVVPPPPTPPPLPAQSQAASQLASAAARRR